MTTPATPASSANSALMRSASARQIANVMLELPRLLICSTLTRANWLSSGTASTSCSPLSEPALYSDRFILESPRPAMVPPVDSTTTCGSSLLFMAGIDSVKKVESGLRHGAGGKRHAMAGDFTRLREPHAAAVAMREAMLERLADCVQAK